MADVYRYQAEENPCSECGSWDGEEGTVDELPSTPNPDCLNHYNCRCSLEFVSSQGDGEGCHCFYNCPGEYWDDDCDCPDPNGCCCVAEDWSRFWSPECYCGGDGGGHGDGDGDGDGFCDVDADCQFAGDVCCWFIDFGYCIPYEEC